MDDVVAADKPVYGVPLISWSSMFMGVAVMAAARSKDYRTRNGACIVTTDNRIVGVGYNGLPRGCTDDDPSYWLDNDDDPLVSRHSYIVHAEVNAILNCVVLPLSGASIYATQFPCTRCAQAIIQAGIRRVIFLDAKVHHARHHLAVFKLFNDVGIECISLKDIDEQSAVWIASLILQLNTPITST